MGNGENSSPEQTPDDAEKLVKCPACWGEIDARAARCRHCGFNIGDASQNLPRHGGVCPFCRESIHEQAIVCRHCGSSVVGESTGPDHGGTCPYCREDIHRQATVCPKCRSVLWQPRGTLRAINGGSGPGYSSDDCTWNCYDLCREKTDKSPRECLRRCRGICRPAAGGTLARIRRNEEDQPSGCGCSHGETSVEGWVSEDAQSFALSNEPEDPGPNLRMRLNQSQGPVVSQGCKDGTWQECPLWCFNTKYGQVCVQICSGCYQRNPGGEVFT
ncbi:zinc ribbon domain-containing protein [Pseudarthrobacter sp. C4D7]|uniref:double zinc ribbon domain-containing protein n=1 Tax=Pseudarthrobacter sp. C4D7 TaxID=2735268 RepID=UPI00158484D7|nr:zinc ribbon domain-containing protein [Pseudarthrobacter sp. C4D7]